MPLLRNKPPVGETDGYKISLLRSCSALFGGLRSHKDSAAKEQFQVWQDMRGH